MKVGHVGHMLYVDKWKSSSTDGEDAYQDVEEWSIVIFCIFYKYLLDQPFISCFFSVFKIHYLTLPLLSYLMNLRMYDFYKWAKINTQINFYKMKKKK